MENKKLLIFGASGHGKVIAELAANNGSRIAAMIDDAPKTASFGLIPIIHTISILKPQHDVALIVAIGNNSIRKKISLKFSEYNFFTVVHKNAIVSPSVSLGLGTVVMLQAIINADAKIGNHVIINTGALIEHDCIIEDFVHISPNVTLSGNVSVGQGSHIGSGAIIIPGVKIGKWCTIGAGTVVISDIPDGATAIGNPAKIIKFNSDFKTLSTNEKVLKTKKVIQINSEYLKLNSYQ
ncbi:acetyltransferase [Flavobacterium sp.]|uniref:acetyltransferase n=1 Tax=Flavobacterium sp. TaxID=239 RepID=UPI00286E39C9|nr:acetyltransferase [Flavobacterium sp.]